MRKLLLLSNALLGITLISSCHSNINPSSSDSGGTATSVNSTDSAMGHTNSAVSVGGGSGMNKDSVQDPDTSHAVIHGAPNQDVIDSLRGAKTKDN